MKSEEMLDVLEKAFIEKNFHSSRTNLELITFFQTIHNRMFKGQALTQENEFIRIELWLNLLFDKVNYDSIKKKIKKVNELNKNPDGSYWMGYVASKEKHHLGVLADIKADSEGNVNIEQCQELYQKVVVNLQENLLDILD